MGLLLQAASIVLQYCFPMNLFKTMPKPADAELCH